MHGETNARTRVKICGITRPEDALQAALLGVDAVGLVFFNRSPRTVTLAQARLIVEALPPFVTTVGLFVDPSAEEVAAVLEAIPLDLLQFHGQEPPELCAAFGRPYVKAVHMRAGVDLQTLGTRYATARALLLDAYKPGISGGTGTSFDWTLIPGRLEKPLILAGGLDPLNVGEAIRTARPYGVDVSSGVEAAKGIKDPQRMAAFMRGVESADAQ